MRRPDSRSSLILRLQRGAGNASTARWLARSEVVTTRLERIREINAQTWAGPLDEGELEGLWGSFDDLEGMLSTSRYWSAFTGSLRAGMDLDNVSGCTPLIKIWLIHDGLFVDQFDELALAGLWAEYGDELPAKAQEYWPTWKRSIALGMEPELIPLVAGLTEQLESDVRLVAEGYLDRNQQAVEDERAALGLDGTGDRLARAAGTMQELVAARDALREIVVGLRSEDGFDDEGAPTTVRVPATFDPQSEPDPPEPGEPTDGTLPWEAVKAHHDLAGRALLAVAGTSPSLYGALKEHRLADVEADPLTTATEILTVLDESIGESRGKLDGDLDWRALRPVIDELRRGAASGSGVDWSERFYAARVTDELGDYETQLALEELGFLLAAVALLFTPAGWAGLVASGLLDAAYLGRHYERWDDLSDAAAAGATPDTELVSSERVAAAQSGMVLAGLGAFLGLAMTVGALSSASKGWESLIALASRPRPRQSVGGFSSQTARSGGREVVVLEGRVGPQMSQKETLAGYSPTLPGEHATHGVGMQLGENLPEGIVSGPAATLNLGPLKRVENVTREVFDNAVQLGATVETKTTLLIERQGDVRVLVGVTREAWVRLPGADDSIKFVDFEATIDLVTREVVVLYSRLTRPAK